MEVPGFEPRASCMLSTRSTTELHAPTQIKVTVDANLADGAPPSHQRAFSKHQPDFLV